jgi:drug/metabolite transporter (DMT)-like permease
MASVRFLLAGMALFAVLKFRGAPWPARSQLRDHAVIGTFLLLGGNGLVVWAEQFIPSGVAALIIGVGPLFIVLTEWAWPGGARPTATTMAALLLGLAGVAWLAAPWETRAQGGLHVGGTIAVLCACGFWAIGSIFSRHAKSGADPLYAASLQMMLGGVSLGLVAILHGDFAVLDVSAISGRSWLAFVYLVLIGSLLGFSVFVWLMKHSTPARVATYAYVNPIVAVLLGWWLLDEPVTQRTLVSAAVIVVAVAMITMQKNKASPAARRA